MIFSTLSNFHLFVDDVVLSFVCLLVDWILGLCYRNLTRETCGLKLASAITFVLQVC